MLKNINKFSKLATIFTILYYLIGRFIMLEVYTTLPNFLFWTVYYVLYLGSMVVSIIIGTIGLIWTYKTERRIRWGLLLLTLFNVVVLVTNLVTFISGQV